MAFLPQLSAPAALGCTVHLPELGAWSGMVVRAPLDQQAVHAQTLSPGPPEVAPRVREGLAQPLGGPRHALQGSLCRNTS